MAHRPALGSVSGAHSALFRIITRLAVTGRASPDRLVQILVFGTAYQRVADTTCSATTLRWAAHGLMGKIALRGKSVPVGVRGRWVIERTHAWMHAYRKLVW